MPALKEFANFIVLNMANLAETYAQLLAESGGGYESFPADQRIASGRRLLRAVIEAYESETPSPLCRIFGRDTDEGPRRWAKDITPSHPLIEVECLGQTLAPVVTNLEASKFLWQILSEVRATVPQPMEKVSPTPTVPAAVPPIAPEDGVQQKVSLDRAEDRLQIDETSAEEHNLLLRTLIDNMPDLIYVKDAESRFIVGNAATARVMGAKTPDELIGKTDLDFYPEDVATRAYADEQTIIQSGRSLIDYEEPIVDPDGNEIWISTTKVPLRNSQGKIVGIVGISRDITQHKQAEKTLAEERNLMRTLIDNIPDCHIFIKDAESQFLITNAAHLQTLGAETLEEVIGKTDFDLFPQELAEQYYADEQVVIQSGQPLFNRVELVIDQTGRKKWYLTNKVPLRSRDDSVVGLVGLSLDITERKQLEQQIQEALERRTLQVQTSTEVAQEIAAAPALDDLFRRVVNLVQDRFGYRHVNVYTLEKDDLVIQAGTGEAGRQMKETGHKIALTAEQSVIARTARSGEPVLVPDVSREPAWLSHPLMSETKSELVVPIKLGDKVLGVLNVENDTVGSLDEEDQLLLLGLCGQIAIAINNCRAEIARRWVEEELQVSEARIHSLLISTDEAVMLLDEKGFIDCNEATLRIFGYTSKDQFINTHPSEQSPPQQPNGQDSWTAANERIATAYREGSHRFEWLHCRTDGTPFPAEVLLTAVELEGKRILQAIVRDISKYKQAEEDVLKFKLGIERSSDAFFLTDIDGQIIYVNSAFEEVYGYSRDEALGKTPRILKSGLIPQEEYKHFWDALLAKQVVAGEIVNKTKDGRLVTIAGSNNPIVNETGDIIGFLSIHRDITERKQAEEALQESERRLKTIMDAVQAGIVIIDAEMREIVDANPAALQMIGAPKDEVIGSVCHQFICPAERGNCPVCDLGQTVDNSERVLLTAQGEAIPIIKNVVIVTLEGRKYLVESFVDITQQKQAEEENMKFKLGIERSQDAFFMTEIDGTIVFTNAAFEEIYGFSPGEALGQTPRILKSGMMPAEHYKNLWEALLSGQTVAGELINKTKDGRLVNIAASNNPIFDQSGEIVGFLAIHRDVSDRVTSEQTLAKRASELEKVAQLSATISTILKTQELLQAIVELTKEYFGLYHAHVYLLNETNDSLDLAAGAGEVGRQMVAEGWRIPLQQEQSVVARAARTRRGIVVNDVREEPGWLPNLLLPDTRSELAVPLILGERILGVLDVQADTVNHFTPQDVHIQTTLATQVAVALQNANLYKQTEDALEETLVLPEFSQALAGTLSVDKILDIFFEGCTTEIGFEYVQLMLVDENQHRIKAIAGVGVSESDLRKVNYSLDSDNILTEIIRTGQTEIVTDWAGRHDWEIFETEDGNDWIRVFAPVILRQENIGVVEAGFNKKEQTTIRASQIRLLGAFIDQTALALDNAKRYEASQRAAHREQTIRQITEKMRATTTLDELVKTTAEELGERLSAGHAVVELGVETDRP